jgi:integrase/recombinase XerD
MGIKQLKRKEISCYKPSDLWSQEDDLLFLKWATDKRDRSYHTMARDLSARPHEILNLKIKDIVFKTDGNKQYAEVLVNGKTGTRHIPLIQSIPYIKDWLSMLVAIQPLLQKVKPEMLSKLQIVGNSE